MDVNQQLPAQAVLAPIHSSIDNWGHLAQRRIERFQGCDLQQGREIIIGFDPAAAVLALPV